MLISTTVQYLWYYYRKSPCSPNNSQKLWYANTLDMALLKFSFLTSVFILICFGTHHDNSVIIVIGLESTRRYLFLFFKPSRLNFGHRFSYMCCELVAYLCGPYRPSNSCYVFQIYFDNILNGVKWENVLGTKHLFSSSSTGQRAC